jgi:hypothetical protein
MMNNDASLNRRQRYAEWSNQAKAIKQAQTEHEPRGRGVECCPRRETVGRASVARYQKGYARTYV